ncbi:transposase [Micromonospora sp. 4G55]|uniref:IS110 family transposase n=1 Tax=Micromonospora sp. 4G55 TaxID=2806102 RepID=UPI002812896B|nr:transposase [Micromonospora sp. 4G55]
MSEDQDVTVGVDTHKDVHVAAVLDQTGRVLGTRGFPTTMRGYAQLATWAESFGTVVKVGMEGSGSYGAGLLRFLTDYGLTVVEVDRPDRSTRRRIGKTDTIDAESAARAVLSGRATGTPKTRHAQVEMIRALRVARRRAMKARIQAGGQVEALIVSAPEPVRQLVRGLAGKRRIRVCAALRPGTVSDPATATKVALRSLLARRWLALQAEIDDLDSHLAALVTAAARIWSCCPASASTPPDNSSSPPATTLTACTPKRLSPDCGVAPIPASSGRTDRHRLHRGGDRDANRALWRITLVRMRCHQPTKDYVTRRTAEGKTKTEIMRCLKRYIAREAFTHLAPRPTEQAPWPGATTDGR